MFEDYGIPFGPFVFVIIIVVVTSIASVLRTMSTNATLREIARSGQPIDPSVVERLGKSSDGSEPGGTLLGGLITLGVAGALVFFGEQLGAIDNDPETAQILRAAAIFPAVIGGILTIFGVITVLRGGKAD